MRILAGQKMRDEFERLARHVKIARLSAKRTSQHLPRDRADDGGGAALRLVRHGGDGRDGFGAEPAFRAIGIDLNEDRTQRAVRQRTMHRLHWRVAAENRRLPLAPDTVSELLLIDLDMPFDDSAQPDARLHDRAPYIAAPDSHAIHQNLQSGSLDDFQNQHPAYSRGLISY